MPYVFGRTARRVMYAGGIAALLVPGAAHARVLPGLTDAVSAIAGQRLWVNPASPARKQAEAWRRSRPADAAALEVIASTPTAKWFGGWNRDIRNDVQQVASQAGGQGALPVLVAYNIPNRDCGSHSAGGEKSASGYRKWIRDFAQGLGGRRAVVVLEPDATASTKCLSPQQETERFDLLADAVRVLKSAKATVYIDAGHSKWLSADDMAARLERSGIREADGFALNVSNYHSTSSNVAFGEKLSKKVGGKHFIIDTSRNGAPNGTTEWCNPKNQAVGQAPTTRTSHPLVDAYLWIKQPGESDGSCGGGPRAGAFWADYAVSLVSRSQYASR